MNGNVILITCDAFSLVSLMQQLSQELEQDETRSFRSQVGSPIANSPPGKYLLIKSDFSCYIIIEGVSSITS